MSAARPESGLQVGLREPDSPGSKCELKAKLGLKKDDDMARRATRQAPRGRAQDACGPGLRRAIASRCELQPKRQGAGAGAGRRLWGAGLGARARVPADTDAAPPPGLPRRRGARAGASENTGGNARGGGLPPACGAGGARTGNPKAGGESRGRAQTRRRSPGTRGAPRLGGTQRQGR